MLHFPILVNDRPIGSVEIVCVSERPWPAPDAGYEYRWNVRLNNDEYSGRLEHDYAAGALVLIAKVLDRVPTVHVALTRGGPGTQVGDGNVQHNTWFH